MEHSLSPPPPTRKMWGVLSIKINEEGRKQRKKEGGMERKTRENLNSLPYTSLTSAANINTENKLWERNLSIFTQKGE